MGPEVQMQVVSVGRQVVWLERAEAKQSAWILSVQNSHASCDICY